MIAPRVTIRAEVGTVHEATYAVFMSFGSCIFLPGMVLSDSDHMWTLFQFPLRIQLWIQISFLWWTLFSPTPSVLPKIPSPEWNCMLRLQGLHIRGWCTWSCVSTSVCFFAVFVSLGLPGGHLSARNVSVVLMAAWFMVTLAVVWLSDWITAVLPPQLSWSWGWAVCVLVSNWGTHV